MKTTKILLLLTLFLIPFRQMLAMCPVSTYTFVDPCLPFAVITPLANTYGCFSYSASNAGASGPNDYYTWNFGDGDTAVGDLVYHCYPSCSVTTVYTVTVGYNSAIFCGPMPTTQNYTISLNPAPQSICTGSTPLVHLAVLTVTVDELAIPEIQFSYVFGDGSGPTFDNTHSYATCGNYIIQIKSNAVMINPPDSCFYYTAVNIPCNSSTEGIPGYILKYQPALIFPNPVSEVLNISSGKTIQSINILDIIGRVCFQENEINETQAKLKIQDFYPGAYFVKLVYTDNSKEHIKFVKK